MSKFVLGIDPGIADCGYAVLEHVGHQEFNVTECGSWKTDKHDSVSERLAVIKHNISDILNRHDISRAGVEELFHQKNIKTAVTVAQARGVVMAEIADKDIPCAEFTPTQVKSMIAGYGKADKYQMKEAIKVLLKLKELPESDDAIDAIGIAVATAWTRM